MSIEDKTIEQGEVRNCALLDCGRPFTPTVWYQLFCSPAHASKARYLRRKAKVDKALSFSKELDNVTVRGQDDSSS